MDIAPFYLSLADNSTDGILFVDAGGTIHYWNCALERLTAVEGNHVVGGAWHPALIELRLTGSPTGLTAICPIRFVIDQGQQCFRRGEVRGRSGRLVPVDVHFIPASSHDGLILGVIIAIRDVSSELSLEARCQRLHELATRDPLTQVANRAELDRVHALLFGMHAERDLPYSLIMLDIDRFKSINDIYGHPAGDEVLRSVAGILKSFCRLGDLVGRYGGEEFTLLLADCSGTVATHRAEELRRALESTAQPALEGLTVTASFGVTEMRPGESPEKMLERADHALLCAKDRNRNTVVYFGKERAERESLAQMVCDLRHAMTIATDSPNSETAP